MNPFRHGFTGYVKHGCRCELCCVAKVKRTEQRIAIHRRWVVKHPEWSKNYAVKHRMEFKKASALWKTRHPDQRREIEWKSHGIQIDLVMYMSLLKQQNNQCPVCGRLLVANRKDAVDGRELAHVDHNHITGKVRGLLCGRCNRAAGLLVDSPYRAERLLLYVRGCKLKGE